MHELADDEIEVGSHESVALTDAECEERLQKIPGWTRLDKAIETRFRFDDFRAPLALLNQVAELAEDVNHHPDMSLSWGQLSIRIWTHTADGLTHSDFVFAARVNRLAGRGIASYEGE